MTPEKVLGTLGLSPGEVHVYLALVRSSVARATQIAQACKIPRTTARHHLDALVGYGIVSKSVKGNTALYLPEHPNTLAALSYKKEQEVIRQRESVTSLIQKLEQEYTPKQHLPRVLYYEGVEGVQKLMKQNTLAKEDIVSFSGGDYFSEFYPQLVAQMRKFIALKAPKKRLRTLRPERYLAKYQNSPLKEHKGYTFIQDFPIDIQVYGDVVTISAMDQGYPIAISIQHTAIAQGIGLLFEEIWKNSQK